VQRKKGRLRIFSDVREGGLQPCRSLEESRHPATYLHKGGRASPQKASGEREREVTSALSGRSQARNQLSETSMMGPL
jgi:hypothetical protein